MRFAKLIGKTLIVIFALIGFIFSGVFIAMQMGWTNVRGTIAERNKSFLEKRPEVKDENPEAIQAVISCKIQVLANKAPDTAKNIEFAYENTKNVGLIEKMFENALLQYKNTSIVYDFNHCNQATVLDTTPIPQTAYTWADSPEWGVLKSVFIRDQEIIKQASLDAGISPRILLGGVIGEQFRFFTGRRDSFKSYFEPLKILATLSKFSYGIAGLKPETVARIDENLKNKNSVFYLGPNMENVITYPKGSIPEEIRFERITDTKDTYYSYLYVGLFMRQVSAQWRAAGYEISNMPGILSTLYNLGFNRSIPKANAGKGGAPITINGQEYSFGELGEQFYYSGELVREFPYPY
jgi:hypothetical protein